MSYNNVNANKSNEVNSNIWINPITNIINSTNPTTLIPFTIPMIPAKMRLC